MGHLNIRRRRVSALPSLLGGLAPPPTYFCKVLQTFELRLDFKKPSCVREGAL